MIKQLALGLLTLAFTVTSDSGDVDPGRNDLNASFTKTTTTDAGTETGHPGSGTPDSADPATTTTCTRADPSGCTLDITCVPSTDSTTGGQMLVRRLNGNWRLGTCTPAAGPGDRAVITRTIVLRAFRRIPLPKAEVLIQPPGHKTLVNFDTLFHTEAEPFRRSVTLLGSRIELDITPASFLWHHGDGTTQTTTSPGIAYAKSIPMERYISHQYEHTGDAIPVSVDTTYSARYRVNGGPWLDVDGTVTATGNPVNLRVVEARAVLLGR
ncbi:hypothetical protein ASG90_20105 [Nocardioides sp. Soil797]|nr:hypothetical protein ASG90_20105 [Nocardioides sp. Soil797]